MFVSYYVSIFVNCSFSVQSFKLSSFLFIQYRPLQNDRKNRWQFNGRHQGGSEPISYSHRSRLASGRFSFFSCSFDFVFTKNKSLFQAGITLDDVRKAKSIKSVASSESGDVSSMEDFDDDSDIGKIESDEDSDAEFEQYLRKSKAMRLKTFMKEHCWQYGPKKSRKEPNTDK